MQIPAHATAFSYLLNYYYCKMWILEGPWRVFWFKIRKLETIMLYNVIN